MNIFNNARFKRELFCGVSFNFRSFSTIQSEVNNKFVFIGAPGVGKGTFAKLICEKNNWFHLSLGDLLREEVNNKTDLGFKVADIMSQGLLVSDKIANEVVLKHISNNKARGFILDGYPRTTSQAEHLDNSFASDTNTSHHNNLTGIELRAVHITLDSHIAIQKLLARQICSTCGAGFNTADIMTEGYDMPAILPDKEQCKLGAQCDPVLTSRNDDTAEVVHRRFEEYTSKTRPLLAYYRERGRLREFDVKRGVKDTEALFQLMTSSIE